MTSTAFTISPVEKTGNALPVLAYIDNPKPANQGNVFLVYTSGVSTKV